MRIGRESYCYSGVVRSDPGNIFPGFLWLCAWFARDTCFDRLIYLLIDWLNKVQGHQSGKPVWSVTRPTFHRHWWSYRDGTSRKPGNAILYWWSVIVDLPGTVQELAVKNWHFSLLNPTQLNPTSPDMPMDGPDTKQTWIPRQTLRHGSGKTQITALSWRTPGIQYIYFSLYPTFTDVSCCVYS